MFRLVSRLLMLALVALPLPGLAQSGNRIPVLEIVKLRVGESMVIYGYIGDCGVLPSSVNLPQAKTGTLSVGKPGERRSRRCGGVVPAVEIVFTATSEGRETFKINEDRFQIRVTP